MSFSKILKNYLPVLLCAALVFILLRFIFQLAFIPSGSMAPTIPDEAIVLGVRITDVERGDIIIFKKEGIQLCKRVIAKGGDSLQIKNGEYYVNGKKEKYGHGTTEGETKVYRVPKSSYFVSGDNRENSEDSRMWKNPYIKKSDIRSKVIFSSGKGELY